MNDRSRKSARSRRFAFKVVPCPPRECRPVMSPTSESFGAGNRPDGGRTHPAGLSLWGAAGGAIPPVHSIEGAGRYRQPAADARPQLRCGLNGGGRTRGGGGSTFRGGGGGTVGGPLVPGTGAAPIAQAGHGATAIAAGLADVVVVSYAGCSYSGGGDFDTLPSTWGPWSYEAPYGFTTAVLLALEDLGFCKKGEGGPFVEAGEIGPTGSVPINTDGGGLSSNHPGRRGVFALIEAVRQLRGEGPGVQLRDPKVALAHGVGGQLTATGKVV